MKKALMALALLLFISGILYWRVELMLFPPECPTWKDLVRALSISFALITVALSIMAATKQQGDRNNSG